MFLIGLTGGIGAGKSTVARRLAEHGAIVLDADQVARDAVAPGTPALGRLTQEFGSDILTPDGVLDRGKLAQFVFGHPERVELLNSIVHPAVRAMTSSKLDQLRHEHPDGVVVYDVPLLIEAGVDHNWDLIVVAMADEGTRLKRLVSERGMSETEAQRRIDHQASDAQRREIADVVIDTGGSLEKTIEQTDQLWASIKNRAGRNI